MRMILHSFYQRMTQSRLSSIIIPCSRKLWVLDLISPSLKVCGLVAGLAAWIALWTGLVELVSRSVVVQPPYLGGFSVVNVKLKVPSLLSQWVRRFAVNPSGWTLLMTYWFLSCFGTYPSVVLARPHSFNHSILPAFYPSLLLAWRSLDGSFDDTISSLVFASRDPLAVESWRIYLQK